MYNLGQAAQSLNTSLPNCSRGPVSRSNPYSVATSQYFICIGRLDRYVERYLTRYHDIYVDEGHDEKATAMSINAIHQLAGRLDPSSGLHQAKSLTDAKVKILCDIYSQYEMPQSIAALDKLVTWAEYIDKHLQISVMPPLDQQCFEQRLADQAESAAEELWQAYRACTREHVAIRHQRSQVEVLEAEDFPFKQRSQPRHYPRGVATTENRADAIALTNSTPEQHSHMKSSLTAPERTQPNHGYITLHRYGDQGTPSSPPKKKTEIQNAIPKRASLSIRKLESTIIVK